MEDRAHNNRPTDNSELDLVLIDGPESEGVQISVNDEGQQGPVWSAQKPFLMSEQLIDKVLFHF